MSRAAMLLFVALLSVAPIATAAGVDSGGDRRAVRWLPSPDALQAAGLAPDRYDGAPPWLGRRGCEATLSPRAKALRERIMRTFGPLPIGGLACRPNTAAPGQTSVHGTGRALDIMTTRGDAIAEWLLTNALAHGVQLVIWRRSLWRAGRTGVRHYGGPNPHVDHIHVEVVGGPGGEGSGPLRRPRLVPIAQ